MKELKKQLKMMKEIKGLANPDGFWLKRNKEKLMNQIANTNVKQERKIESYGQNLGLLMKIERNIEAYIPRNFKNSFKPALVVFLALFFTSGGWIASAYAEPGDMFWGTKVAINSVMERSQIALAAPDEETKLHLKFASKKADVIKQVSEKTEVGKEDKIKIIKDTKDKLKENLDDANESLKKTSSEKASGMVKEVSLKTSEIAKSVKESAEKVKVEDKELAKDLDKTLNDTQKTSLEMVEVVLQKKVESQNEITDEEKNIITTHIASIVGDLEDHLDSLKEEKEMEEKAGLARSSSTDQFTTTTTETELNVSSTESVQDGSDLDEDLSSSTISDSDFQASSTEELTSTTTEVELTTSTIDAGKIVEVKVILEKTKEELEKGKDEVNLLVEADILGAVQKAKQITEATKQAEDQINIIEKGEGVETQNFVETQNLVSQPEETQNSEEVLGSEETGDIVSQPTETQDFDNEPENI